MGLLDRNIATIEDRLLLLTPSAVPPPNYFGRASIDKRRHRKLVQETQRLRGSVYLHDGAIRREELSPGGLHTTPQDHRSWHLLLMNGQHVTGCIWYLEHEMPTTMTDLRVHRCPLLETDEWSPRLRNAIESEIARAEGDRVPYAEVGGWAVSHETQRPADGFLLAMAAYSLSRILGGAIGVTTATRRHSSAQILRRLGLAPLAIDGTPIPGYYDPKYRCDMELLRFDSRNSNPKYHGAIEVLKRHLASVEVVSTTDRVEKSFGFPYPVYAEPVYAA